MSSNMQEISEIQENLKQEVDIKSQGDRWSLWGFKQQASGG